MIELGFHSWSQATKHGLTRIRANYTDTNRLITTTDSHQFINMCSCSYLGLDKHPKIINNAINAIKESRTLILPTSRTRIGVSLLDDVERKLSELFSCDAIVALSCSAASAGILPIIAAGILTNHEKPTMVFDKQCHFSMNLIKPICGDETNVITCEHNDLNYIEYLCKKNSRLVYVADGAYSMGGYAPVRELRYLQEKYGLYLYFDDSHAISAYGQMGIGYVRQNIGELNERTIVVGSLGKAFGATGGIIMLNNKKAKQYIEIFGGPLGWSQTVNTAGLGAILGSIDIHRSDELYILQNKLRENIRFFDSIYPTKNSGNDLPIRVIEISNPDQAILLSSKIYKAGFYTSAVYFPIVKKGKAGLRVMLRADLTRAEIKKFIDMVKTLS